MALKAPMNFVELIQTGGVEARVHEAVRREREFWLDVLESYPEPEDILEAVTLQSNIARLRRQLGIKQDIDTIRAQTRERVRLHRERKRAAGGM
jgi:hypothetical protein